MALMTTRAGYTFETDKHGFPLEDCGRCGGSGHHSYCSRFGTKCFDCGGNEVRISKGAAEKHVLAYNAAVEKLRRCEISDVKPGDQIRPWGNDMPFREVATVRRTALIVGLCWTGGALRSMTLEHYVTYTDGGTARIWGTLLRRRVTTPVDPAPYVEAAQKAHVAKLRRRKAQRKDAA